MATARWAIWVRNAALVGVIAAFILFFGLPTGTAPVDVVAEVDGESVGRDIFEFFRSQNARLLADVEVPGMDAAGVSDLIDRQTIDGLLRRYILGQEARALGLRVSDAEVREEILADPGFRDESGRFDRERFEIYVARNDLGSERVYTEELRRDLLLRKFRQAVTSPVRVSEAQVRRDVVRGLTSVRLRYAVARRDRFRGGAPPAETEIATFVQSQQSRLQEAYDRRRAEFQQPETVRARHMLFQGEGALERARQALARVHDAEPFDAVARELSEDEATREQGGALGTFPRGRMLPEFEQVAFGLAPGEVSEPVETSYGFHVILVEEHRTGVERSLEEVAPELARELLEGDRAREQARAAAALAADRIRAGQPLDEAAAAAGLELDETPVFRLVDPQIPVLGELSGVRETALGLTLARPSSPRVFEGTEGFYLISLLERQEPEPDQVELEVSRAREQLQEASRAALQDRWYRTRRRELERRGALAVYPPGERG